MGLTEFPKMSHIIISGDFKCHNNQITSFKGCPTINGNFICSYNKIISFKDCPIIGGNFICSVNRISSFEYCPVMINGDFLFWGNPIKTFKDYPVVEGDFMSDILILDKIYKCSKENNITLLEAQVDLYNRQVEELLAHIDKFPDLIAYIRMKELNKLL